MRRNALLALCGLWILAASLAAAATPRVLHYEGRLTDAAGVPLAGPVTLTFTFHGAPAGGAALAGFTDTDEVTPDAQGVVSTWVGDDPALPIPALILESGEVWLNIAVNGENLTPRKRIASVPYAMRADLARCLVRSFAVTDNDTVAEGDPVAILPDGTIRRGIGARQIPPGRVFYTGEFEPSSVDSTVLDDTRLVVAYTNYSNGHSVARVAKRTETGFDFGDEVEFASVVSSNVSLAPLGDSAVLVAWNEDSGAAKIQVAFISELEIDFSRTTAVTFAPYARDIRIAVLSPERFLIAFVAATERVDTNYLIAPGKALVGRLDRGAIDFTGASELAFNKQFTDSPALVALTESRAALLWINKGRVYSPIPTILAKDSVPAPAVSVPTGDLWIALLDVDGGDVDIAVDLRLSQSCPSSAYLSSIAEDRLLVFYYGVLQTVNVIAGPPLELEAGKPADIPDIPGPSPAFLWAGALSPVYKGLAWICYEFNNRVLYSQVDVSGDTPELGKLQVATYYGGVRDWAMLDPKAPVLVYPRFLFRIGEDFDFPAGTLLGVALETAPGGATALVALQGVAKVNTSTPMTPGVQYQVRPDGSLTDQVEPGMSMPGANLGRAVSSNEILVEPRFP